MNEYAFTENREEKRIFICNYGWIVQDCVLLRNHCQDVVINKDFNAQVALNKGVCQMP